MRHGATILQKALTCALAACLAAVVLLAGCAGVPVDGGTPQIALADESVEGRALAREMRGREEIVLRATPPPQQVAVAALFGSATRSVSPKPDAPPAAPEPAAKDPVAKTAENLFDVVTVLWGTDRAMPSTGGKPIASSPMVKGEPIVTGSVPTTALPGADRGDRLTLGRSHVTIPRTAREKGKILRPRQFTFLNYTLYSEREDPRKHFTIADLESLDPAAFFHAANVEGAKGSRFKDQALVFVHGYNVTFEHALYRTAQLAHDLEFDGVPYLYSWPSKGEESGYLYDRDSADRARTYFLEFLGRIALETHAKKVHIIAHSIGTRPLLEALRTEKGKLAQKFKIGEVILAAPDIDADVFADIAKTIQGASHGVTLYASANDKALKASKAIAGGSPRAGDVPAAGPLVVPGIDTIDITQAGPDSFLGFNHSTYAERNHVLSDMWLLLKEGVHPPDKRFAVFRPVTLANGETYWKYMRN